MDFISASIKFANRGKGKRKKRRRKGDGKILRGVKIGFKALIS